MPVFKHSVRLAGWLGLASHAFSPQVSLKNSTLCHKLRSSVLILTIAVGVEDRPAAAPQDGPYKSNYKLVGDPTFYEAISALSSMVFAYAGTPAFFSIISEMREPRDYTKSLIACQGTVTATYTAIGIVVYYYCGSYVASPALGSAGHLMKKVCYGIALPGLLVSCLILLHVSLLQLQISRTNRCLAASQVHLRSPVERKETSYREHYDTLDRLVLVHHHYYCNCLRCC